MKTSLQQKRLLTAEEIDAVAGGMSTVFRYGDLVVEIYADKQMYSVATTNLTTGQSTTRTTL